MNRNELSKPQARHLYAAMVPTIREAFKAQAAMSELVIVLHYLTCDGVGEPTRETDT